LAGSAARLTDEQQAELKADLRQHLYHTAKEVVAWVRQRFGQDYSTRGMQDLLHRLDVSFQKIRLVPGKADVEAQRAFLQEYRQLQVAAQPTDRWYFMDGVHPMHNVHPGYGWGPRGERLCLPSNTGRQRYNILGVYCPQDREYLDEQTIDSLNAQTVIALGDKIRHAHPNSRNIIFCDNVRYQHAKIVREHFENTNIEFHFLPAYSPNLNLIERLWKFMKAKVLSKYYPTFEEFVQAIRDFLSHLDRYADQLASLMTEEFEILVPVA
jgi:transposase